MHVQFHGPEDGTPIVFLHGAMVAGWMWLGQVEGLPEYRCLLPDLPGMGASSGEPWLGIAESADAVAEVIRTQCPDGSAHVVGLSLGGLVALRLAERAPEQVRSLIVSGVPHGAVPLPLRALSAVMARLYGHPRGARLVAALFGIPDDESRAAFLDTAARTRPEALRAVMDEVASGALPAHPERIAVPTLLVVGERDSAPAIEAVPWLAARMPDAPGFVVPGVGHQWNAEAGPLFTEMVRSWVFASAVPVTFRAV
jgi:pimeloyl-ACP methyl ester carboxylesterase